MQNVKLDFDTDARAYHDHKCFYFRVIRLCKEGSCHRIRLRSALVCHTIRHVVAAHNGVYKTALYWCDVTFLLRNQEFPHYVKIVVCNRIGSRFSEEITHRVQFIYVLLTNVTLFLKVWIP